MALPSPLPTTERDLAPQPGRGGMLAQLSLGQVAMIVFVAIAAWALSSVLMLIFFAVLLGASFRGAADWVAARTGMPVTLALAAVVVAVVAVLVGLFYSTGPTLYAQLNDLGARLMTQVEHLQGRLRDNGLMQGGDQLQTLAERVVSPAAQIFTFSLSTLTELLVAVVTAIYFAASPRLYVGGMVRLVPKHHRDRLRQVLAAVGHAMRMWVLGQLINMVAIGLLASIGLWLVGVPAPVALGLISGLFTFVPYVGTLVSGVIAITIALSAGLSTALWALGVFCLCHVFEGYVIAPLVQKRILELPPALSVLSMTVLGTLFGLAGIVLGTPFAAALLVLVQALYVGDVLGDRAVDPTQ